MNLQLQKFNQKNVELVPDTIDLMTDTELTQYYIQSWSLEQRNIGSRTNVDKAWRSSGCDTLIYFDIIAGSTSNGLKMEIVFKRRLTNELLTTYLPSLLLLLMSYATTFFKPFYFEAAVTVNLSILLVTTTLFIRYYITCIVQGHHRILLNSRSLDIGYFERKYTFWTIVPHLHIQHLVYRFHTWHNVEKWMS